MQTWPERTQSERIHLSDGVVGGDLAWTRPCMVNVQHKLTVCTSGLMTVLLLTYDVPVLSVITWSLHPIYLRRLIHALIIDITVELMVLNSVLEQNKWRITRVLLFSNVKTVIKHDIILQIFAKVPRFSVTSILGSFDCSNVNNCYTNKVCKDRCFGTKMSQSLWISHYQLTLQISDTHLIYLCRIFLNC